MFGESGAAASAAMRTSACTSIVMATARARSTGAARACGTQAAAARGRRRLNTVMGQGHTGPRQGVHQLVGRDAAPRSLRRSSASDTGDSARRRSSRPPASDGRRSRRYSTGSTMAPSAARIETMPSTREYGSPPYSSVDTWVDHHHEDDREQRERHDQSDADRCRRRSASSRSSEVKEKRDGCRNRRPQRIREDLPPLVRERRHVRPESDDRAPPRRLEPGTDVSERLQRRPTREAQHSTATLKAPTMDVVLATRHAVVSSSAPRSSTTMPLIGGGTERDDDDGDDDAAGERHGRCASGPPDRSCQLLTHLFATSAVMVLMSSSTPSNATIPRILDMQLISMMCP